MSRSIRSKIIVRGTMEAVTPIAVGGVGGGDHTDMELARDGTGAYYIPGTSLAGPMRAWLEDNCERCVEALFGYIEDRGEGGSASCLYIEDSRIDGNVISERRHGISIDAHRGTAKEGFFYTRALLPRGTRFPLNMELDVTDGCGDEAESALSGILSAVKSGAIRFGACKTRGMGRVMPAELTVDRCDFEADADALDNWLNGMDSSVHGGAEILRPFCGGADGSERIGLDIPWQALSPLMVKDGRDGVEADMLPLMSGTGYGIVTPVIPGSSLKGVLRAQAGRILSTIFRGLTEDAKALMRDVFGSEKNAGLLSVDDVYYLTKNDIKLTEWLSEENLDGTPTERHQYVAIDRFTGGASDSALYNARPVRADGDCGRWDDMHMTLRLPRGADITSRRTASALLHLLLRDMRDGYVPIGFGSRRGMGFIKADIADAVRHMCETVSSCSDMQSAWDSFTGGKGYTPMIRLSDDGSGGMQS